MLFYFNIKIEDSCEDQANEKNYTGFVSGENFSEAVENLGLEANFEDKHSSVLSISLESIAPDNYLAVCDDNEKLNSMVQDLALEVKETAIW